jgi:hypothetical protein
LTQLETVEQSSHHHHSRSLPSLNPGAANW